MHSASVPCVPTTRDTTVRRAPTWVLHQDGRRVRREGPIETPGGPSNLCPPKWAVLLSNLCDFPRHWHHFVDKYLPFGKIFSLHLYTDMNSIKHIIVLFWDPYSAERCIEYYNQPGQGLEFMGQRVEVTKPNNLVLCNCMSPSELFDVPDHVSRLIKVTYVGGKPPTGWFPRAYPINHDDIIGIDIERDRQKREVVIVDFKNVHRALEMMDKLAGDPNLDLDFAEDETPSSPPSSPRQQAAQFDQGPENALVAHKPRESAEEPAVLEAMRQALDDVGARREEESDRTMQIRAMRLALDESPH